MKSIYLIALLFFVQLPLHSQQTVKVLDPLSKEPVPNAGIFFPDTKTGTRTNDNGFFTIDTKLASVLLEVTSPGYKTFLGSLDLTQKNPVIYLEPSTHSLKEVTVSAGNSKLQGENVSNVENIRLKDNPLMQGTSLVQKLSTVAGVSNYSTGTGIGKPVIRGLSGNRIAVFSQGIRIENQQWGDEHGLGLDENGYEQVELVKGPASLLYGSDALGGVLYFSNERYAAQNSLDFNILSEYNSNTDGWRNAGGLKLSKDRFHWNLFGGYTTHKDYKDGNKDLVHNSRFHTGDLKTSLGYTGQNFSSSLKYNYLHEVYGLASNEDEEDAHAYPNGRSPETPYQGLTTHLLSSENTLFFRNRSKLKVDLGYILNNRKEYEGDAHDHDHDHEHEHEHAHSHDHGDGPSLDMDLRTLSYTIKWYSPEMKDRWTLIAGSQGMYQKNKNQGVEALIPNATTKDLGFFVTSDYYYTKKSYWQAGIRVDGRFIKGTQYGEPEEETYIPSFSEDYYAFNFSTGVFHSFSDVLSLRASLSSGFRAPNMFELLSNGLHEGTNRYEIGNPDLKTENSYQADASLNYQGEHLEVFFNPYFNYIRNYIYLRPTGEMRDEKPVYGYTQHHAFLLGGEAGFHFHPHPLDWLHLETSYSSTYGRTTDGKDLPLIPAPRINATLSAIFSGNKLFSSFSAFLQYQYSFKQNRTAAYEIATGDYSLVHAGVHVELKVNKYKFLLDASVQNLFNQTYYDHLSRYKTEGIYNIGRNFVCKLTIPINVAL